MSHYTVRQICVRRCHKCAVRAVCVMFGPKGDKELKCCEVNFALDVIYSIRLGSPFHLRHMLSYRESWSLS